jgi:beta-1,2-rhamnosyltransferase WsaF-like protein
MRVIGLPGKIIRHMRLLRDDPERFARNLLQFTNPRRFREKLIDIEVPPPLHLRFDAALDARRTLNVLLPVLSSDNTTGGPNTVLHFALRIAGRGVPVRMVTTRPQATTDPAWFRRHLTQLAGGRAIPEAFEALSAADPDTPLAIGRNDVFMATHWTTVQQMKGRLPELNQQEFIYLIQDFEPGFHPWSSNYALTLETYDLDFVPVFNEQLLADYFTQCAVGRFADPGFARTSLVFEPAVDRTVFFPAAVPHAGRRCLLFYARPTNERNLFGLGLHALRSAAAHSAFAGWEFQAIGGRGGLPDFELGDGRMLRNGPWLDYAGYAEFLRGADILLCLMLSPHTSYPVLEMAACGGVVVTNSFASKTAERLGRISPNIIAARPAMESIATALIDAAGRVSRGYDRLAPLVLPNSWDESLTRVAGCIADWFTRARAAR